MKRTKPYISRALAALLVLVMSFVLLAGCNNDPVDPVDQSTSSTTTTTASSADVADPTDNGTTDTSDTDATGGSAGTTAPSSDASNGGTSIIYPSQTDAPDNDNTTTNSGGNKTTTTAGKGDGKTTTTKGKTTTATTKSTSGSLSLLIPTGGKKTTTTTNGNTHTVTIKYYRGVNVSGAEFGNFSGGEGNQYGWNSEQTYKYFTEQGFNLFRVPFLWGRMQPTLGGPLDQQYLAGLKRNVAWAKKYGGVVVLDLHNYGGYDNGQIRGQIDGNGSPVTTAHLIDIWTKLSNEFKDETAIYAYGIMNEPHDMNGGNWYEISQAVVTAIRNNGDKHMLSIPNDNWTGAHSWPVDMDPWIDDPLDNIIYEAHQYFDSDSSGTYVRSYDQELARFGNDEEAMAMVGVDRMRGFVEWCNKHNVRGYMAEFSVPNWDSRWLTVLENFMTYLDENGIDATFWSAGERWAPDEQLSVQPSNNFTSEKVQMKVLKQHGPGTAKVQWAKK